MAESWNPEPPAEILSIQKDDLIEGTLFDKHNIVQTLLKLIQLIDSHSTSHTSAQESSYKELDEDLEKELCDLWDMSSEIGVCQFLIEYNCLSLFEAYMRKYDSVYPRAIELILGIMVNMVTLIDETSLLIVECDSFVNYLLFQVFIGMTDTQSILQSVYLLNILLGYTDSKEKKEGSRVAAKEKLIKLIYDQTDEDAEYLSPMLEKVQFILSQSLNGSLLDCTCSLLLNLMYTSDSYLIKIAQDKTVVESICSAASTRSNLDHTVLTKEGYSTRRSSARRDTSATPTPNIQRIERDDDISDLDHIYNKYFLCLQTLSTCEPGTIRLNESSESVFKLMGEYLSTALSLLASWEAQHGVKILDGFIGVESISNFTCLTSTLDAIISSSTRAQSQFLVKFLSFTSYYLRFFIECKDQSDVTQVENGDMAVSAVRELLDSLKAFSDIILDKKLEQLVSECANLVAKL